MKVFLCLSLSFLTAPAFADVVKIDEFMSTGSGKSAKAVCSDLIHIVKTEVTKKCLGIEGNIVSWNVSVNPNIEQRSCDVTVTGSCDADL